MMKIGDRVAYDEQNRALDDICGTVTEPTESERAQANTPDVVFRAGDGDVMVEWDDGERFWEDPTSLVVVEKEDR